MSDRPIGLGKVAENGTLNENGAFYSVQDINVLLEENAVDLPTPAVADAGKAVVVDAEGKYSLGEAGEDLPTPTVADAGKAIVVDAEGKYALGEAGEDLPTPTVADAGKAVVVDAEGNYTLGEAGGGNTVIIPLSSDGNTIQITAGELREYIAEHKNIVLEIYTSATYGDVTFERDTRFYLIYYNTNEVESETPAISQYLFDFMYYDQTDPRFLIRRFYASTLADNPVIGQ